MYFFTPVNVSDWKSSLQLLQAMIPVPSVEAWYTMLLGYLWNFTTQLPTCMMIARLSLTMVLALPLERAYWDNTPPQAATYIWVTYKLAVTWNSQSGIWLYRYNHPDEFGLIAHGPDLHRLNVAIFIDVKVLLTRFQTCLGYSIYCRLSVFRHKRPQIFDPSVPDQPVGLRSG